MKPYKLIKNTSRKIKVLITPKLAQPKPPLVLFKIDGPRKKENIRYVFDFPEDLFNLS
jgi:hypothetical protein